MSASSSSLFPTCRTGAVHVPRCSPRDPDPCHPSSLTPSMFRAVPPPHPIAAWLARRASAPVPPGAPETARRAGGECLALLCRPSRWGRKAKPLLPGPTSQPTAVPVPAKGPEPVQPRSRGMVLTAEPGAEQSGETTYSVLYLYFLKRQYTLATLSLGLHKTHFIKQSRLRQSNHPTPPPPPQLSGFKHQGGHRG